MARSGNNGYNRCACGGARRRNNRRSALQNCAGAAGSPLAQQLSVGGEERTSCPVPTTAQELYGATLESESPVVTCCDMYRGCQQFLAGDRNPFWPTFSHPRWLSCRELYGDIELE